MNALICFDSKFMLPAVVAIYSLFKNNSNVKLNIFYSDLTQNEKKCIKLLTKIDESNQITFMKVDNDGILKDAYSYGHYPVQIYYRYLAYKLLDDSIKRVLYLDTDVIVKSDISGLYNMNFEDNYFVGCEDITSNPLERLKLNDYINSGVLLMNLEKLRKDDHMNHYWSMVSDKEYHALLPDQDALNIIFHDEIEYISNIEWNCFPFYRDISPDVQQYIMSKSKVVHYLSKRKPWLPEYEAYWNEVINKNELTNYFYQLYLSYMNKAVDFIEHVSDNEE